MHKKLKSVVMFRNLKLSFMNLYNGIMDQEIKGPENQKC